MSLSDPLLMLADIALLSFEHSDLDEGLVRAIYQHQVITTGRQPTLPEAREYIGHLTSHLDDITIRVTLGLPPPRPSGDGAHRPRAVRARRPGRPAWTAELFAVRYQAALERATPPHTYQSIADQFEMLDGSIGTDPDHLRKLMRRYGQTPG
jgi:hypothetical protein